MRDSFLGNVAKALYGRYGDDVSSMCVVMPNRRSWLFFLEELAAAIGKPIWQPRFATIDDLMGEIAGMAQADHIRVVVELYKVWRKFHPADDFDKFYFWGETLLSDFDQVDKYMIDARALFTNIGDLKNMGDELEWFNEEQRKVVARFWSAFGDAGKQSEEKERFRTIWDTLWPVYGGFRERLAESGMAYTGMIHRTAAEKIKARQDGSIPAGALGGAAQETLLKGDARYAVVGFNALSKSEKALFDYLRDERGAEFFWDYDDYYITDSVQEAGLFAKENIARYPQPPYFLNPTDNFERRKEITAVSLPSDSMQCKYAAEFLREVEGRQGYVGRETAIVLTNEDLLVPLLYSLPESVGDINVTMGYPLRQSLAYSFTERLLRLQNNKRMRGNETFFYHSDATGLLQHPFVVAADSKRAREICDDIVARSRMLVPQSLFADGATGPDESTSGAVGDTLLARIFSPQWTWDGLVKYIVDILSRIVRAGLAGGGGETEDKMQREFFGEIADTLRKLANSLDECGVGISVQTASSLARRMLQNVRIPYSGEPLSGLQVMGILETRNLDFDNVLILSMNDDNFPGNPSASSSFIPFNLRYGYGLPTPQHHDGVYAYYFYRLLQRAGHVTFAYSSATSEDSSGEPSRYIYQLDYESPHKLERRNIAVSVNLPGVEEITVEKSGDAALRLARYLDGGGRTISPSAFNAYLDCPLRFYFRSIAELEPDEEVAEDIDAAMFGNILHKAMETLYTPFVGVPDPAESIGRLRGTAAVAEAVDKAIAIEFFDGEPFAEEEIAGNLLLVRDIIRRYIDKNILPYDAALGGFTILHLEKELECDFEFADPDGVAHSVRFKGKADRIDLLDGGLVRVVDYKTGSPGRYAYEPYNCFGDIEALFGDDPRGRRPAILQTFLYSLMASSMQERGELEGVEAHPALYYVRSLNDPEYSHLPTQKEAGRVDSYAPYREQFEGAMAQKLAGLFDPDVPFAQCADSAPCKHCDFAVICRR